MTPKHKRQQERIKCTNFPFTVRARQEVLGGVNYGRLRMVGAGKEC